MTSRISPYTEKRIYELWFDGLPRDKIAEQMELSGSTISNVVSKLPGNLRGLRQLGVELQKSGLSVSEAEKGARIISKMTQLGVSPNQLPELIRTLENLCENAGYGLKEVVNAAMRLSKLEVESGKPYLEALRDFQARKDNAERLKEKEEELVKRVREKEKDVARAGITEKEIAHITKLRQDFRKHDVTLEEVESFHEYLKNMEETGGDPKRFVRYTKSYGLFKERLTQLKRKVRIETANLKRLKQEGQLAQATADTLQAQVLSLREERRREQEALSTLSAHAARMRHELKIEFAQKRENLQALQKRTQELENKNQSIEDEIQDKLRIKNYVDELETAIAAQESQKTLLEKENCEKRERLALADAITEFLTKIPTYDFNRFYFKVETIKRLRENGTCSPGLLPIVEEETRTLALRIFEGDLVSKKQHRQLMQNYDDCRKNRFETERRLSELEAKHEETKGNLERTTSEKRLLEAMQTNFEGRSTTLEELRNWTVSTFNEEIERRVDERFNTIGAGIYGILDFVANKITSRFSNQQRDRQ